MFGNGAAAKVIFNRQAPLAAGLVNRDFAFIPRLVNRNELHWSGCLGRCKCRGLLAAHFEPRGDLNPTRSGMNGEYHGGRGGPDQRPITG